MKKREFKRALVRSGGEGVLESPREQRWRKELLKGLEVVEWKTPAKCVNDFMIGGDPEFVLQERGEAVCADSFLAPGLAFGADQNGRLGELRVAPSRSALDLVAGIFKTLNWLGIYLDAVGLGGLSAIAAPSVYFKRLARYDGCGGHIHFGRKSSEARRREEVEQLDWLYGALINAEVWFKLDCESRNTRAGYGKFGDTRIQKHGFEYRAFPSWLENPWKAFLVLTLAKLTVHDPSLARWELGGTNFWRKVDLFLGYYQGLDDDARLARVAWRSRGVPREGYGEVFGSWGRVGLPKQEVSEWDCWPASFKVEDVDRQQVFRWLLKGERLKFRNLEADWGVTKLPAEFLNARKVTNFWRITGVGDLCAGLVVSEKYPVRIQALDRSGKGLWVSDALAKMLAKGWQEEIRKAGFEVDRIDGPRLAVYTSKGIRDNPFMLERAKSLLTSGMFPIWREQEVEVGKLKKWEQETVRFRGISLVKGEN